MAVVGLDRVVPPLGLDAHPARVSQHALGWKSATMGRRPSSKDKEVEARTRFSNESEARWPPTAAAFAGKRKKRSGVRLRIVFSALVGAVALGCASSPAPAPSGGALSRAAGDSSEAASSPAELLAAARRYTRRGDRHVQRCELDTARAEIERAVRTYEQSLRSADVDYAEALGARSHLRKQLDDLPGAALDLSRSIALLGRHERDALPALFSAYAELVSVYQAAGRHADAPAAVPRSIDVALRRASTAVAPAQLPAGYRGLVGLADPY